jgi:hypothetical protein
MIGTKISPLKPVIRSGSVNSLLATWYNSLSVKPSAGLLTDLTTLATTLNSAGIWTEMDLFHVIGGLETDEQRLKPLKSTSGSDFTNVNSATLATGGVTGNGATSYLNLNWNPSTHGSKYTQNSASLGIYSRTDSSNANCDMGVYIAAASAFSQCYFGYTGVTSVYRSNSSTLVSKSNAGSLGTYSWRRTASNATESFKNGTSLGTDASVTNAVPNGNLFLCALNLSGTAGQFQTRQQAMVMAGSGAFSHATFRTAIQTYMTSRGINV